MPSAFPILVLTFFQRLFNSADFMPHGHCYFWRPEVLWLHVVADALIALAYYSIPLTLVYLVRKRRDLPFRGLFWLFGLFIVACGTTHIFNIITVWNPMYRIDGVIKAITAVASVVTAAVLIPIVPKALGLASPTKLLAANALLEQEIAARKEAEAQLAAANHEMEQRVRDRTAELGEFVERLRESEGRLHAVLNAAPVVLFAADRDGIFTFSEGHGLAHFGLAPGERVGQSLLEVNRTHPEVLEGFRRALAGESVQIETAIADLTMDLRFSPTREPSGEIIGVTGIGVDVTEGQLAREHLLQIKNEAERANNAKSDFLSRMSHELRTPLNAILGFAQVLEMQAQPPEANLSIQQILKGGRHLLALIDEVLDLTRIESGSMELTIEPVALRESVEEALKLIQPLAAPRRIRLQSVEGAPAVYVMADKLRVHQTLMALLTNAVKFNRADGTVSVSWERRYGQVRLNISDTGAGIARADMAKLFRPFERLKVDERNVDGAGIGLTLSKRLTESQGGKIGVESQPGEGSTFWIELPFAEAPDRNGTGPGLDFVPADTSTPHDCTVLYIEDNVSNFTLIESILRHYPRVRLIAAMQGHLGVEMARLHRPDLILLDLRLPDITGDEVFRRLQNQEETRDTPVVMLSADATVAQRQRLRAAGVREYLTKPLDVRKFLVVVDEALRSKTTGNSRLVPA